MRKSKWGWKARNWALILLIIVLLLILGPLEANFIDCTYMCNGPHRITLTSHRLNMGANFDRHFKALNDLQSL